MFEGKLDIRRTMAPLLRYLTPAVLAAVAVGIISWMALFVPPYIGMADNGDFFRIIYGNGLYFNVPNYDEQYLGNFVREYGIMQYFNENGSSLFSSQSLFIRLAIWINQIFINDVVFDIRIQSAIYWMLLITAVYLLVQGLTWRTPGKLGYPIAALAVFVFGDTGYTAYFNSFYGESIVLLMSLFAVSSVLLLCLKRYNDYVLLAVFTISMLLLTTAKQQNAPVGVLAGVAGWMLLYVRQSRSFRFIASSALVLLLVAGVATYALIPQQFVHINQYHAMTRGPLLLSDNPEETLRYFGIDEQYALLTGSIYYERYTTVDVDSPVLEDDFYDRFGFLSLLGYYLTHPAQTSELLNLAAKHAFTVRPAAMGNYEQAAGKPFGEHTSFFTGYSTLKGALAPKTFGFIVLWMIAIIGLNAPSFIRACRSREWRRAMKLPMLVMFMLIGMSGIAVSLIGAGDADLAKHQFLFTVMFDMVSVVAVADFVTRKHWRSMESKGRGLEI